MEMYIKRGAVCPFEGKKKDVWLFQSTLRARRVGHEDAAKCFCCLVMGHKKALKGKSFSIRSGSKKSFPAHQDRRRSRDCGGLLIRRSGARLVVLVVPVPGSSLKWIVLRDEDVISLRVEEEEQQ